MQDGISVLVTAFIYTDLPRRRRVGDESAGREPVEQQVNCGVGHGAAAPRDVPLLRSLPPGRGGSLHRGRLPLASQLLLLPQLLVARPRVAVAGRHRLPRPLHRRGEPAEPQVGRRRRRSHGDALGADLS
jgi:hypothetical protein